MLRIKYEFRRAVDTYKQGLLKDQIHTILQNSVKIGDKISELVGQEKFQKYPGFLQLIRDMNLPDPAPLVYDPNS